MGAAMIRAYLAWLGYKIRPYDQMADARRWFWQRRTPCGAPAALAVAIQRAVDAGTFPGNHGQRVDRDPTHGRIDRDIQERVNEMQPTTLGERVALENDLQGRRDRGVQSPGSETHE